ncbi:MAG: hypothetical protein Q9219_000580 [cf. Caloplaca sp. 3 TL-2023]
MLFIEPPPSPFEPPSILYHCLSSPLRFFVQALYRFLLYFRGSAIRTPDFSSRIRLVCISDTHAKKATVPEGDVLIHAGDLANQGTAVEIQDQIDWLDSLPHPYKIMIAGNHDSFFDPRSRNASDLHASINFHDVKYLQHSSVTLTFPGTDRHLTFYGAPQIPACGGDDFAFQYPREQDAWSGTIPRSTDVLITHTPPRYHLDLPHSMGCKYLLQEMWRLRPKVHVFGHVHAGYGRENAFWDEGQKAYERVCSRKVAGFLRDFIDPVAWLDAGKVIWYGVKSIIWTQVWGGDGRGTLMVNASLTYRSTGRLANAPQVINI